MKKALSFILAAVLCLGMITTVVASNKGFSLINSPVIDNSTDSPSIDNSIDSPTIDNSDDNNTGDNNTDDNNTGDNNTGDNNTSDNDVTGPTKVAVDPNKVVGLDGKPIGAKNLEDVYTAEELEVILAAGKSLLAGGVDAYADIWVPDDTEGTILVPIPLTENAVVKAYVYKNNVWSAVTGKFHNENYAAVTSDSYCPVRVTVDYDPVVAGGDNTTGASTDNTTGTTSPKTGEANMALYVAMIGVIALGGVVYGKRRAK